MRAETIVIGIGNLWREDDAIGIKAIENLRPLAEGGGFQTQIARGNALELLDLFSAARHVIVIDCVTAEDPPGTLKIIDAHTEEVLTSGTTSSHALGLAEAIKMGRHLKLLPEKLTVIGVVGRRFEMGERMSPEVSITMPKIVETVQSLVNDAVGEVSDRSRDRP